MRKAIFLSLSLCLCEAGTVGAELFVSPAGNDAASGGVTTPLRSITAAIARAKTVGGVTIRVLPGSYTAATESFPLEPGPFTVITAHDPTQRPKIGGTDDFPIFWVHDIPANIPTWPAVGEPAWPEPDAHAPILENLILRDGGMCPGGIGGGLKVTGGSVYLIGCDLVENHTGLTGAGLAAEGSSKVVAKGCRIARNFHCSVISNEGVGIALFTASVGVFDSCEIIENDSNEGTAGLVADQGCEVFMRNSRILDNYGSPFRAWGAKALIKRCIISGHPIYGPASAALEVTNGDLRLRDSLIYANGCGYGVLLFESYGEIDGCVVAYNELGSPSESGGEGLYASSDFLSPKEVFVSNSIFWANNVYGETNGPPPFHTRRPSVLAPWGEVRYCIAERNTPPFDDGTHAPRVSCIEADPLFVDPFSGDFRLQPGSPGIDAGDPSSPPDSDGTRRDIGVHFPDLVPRYVFMRGDPNHDGVTDISDGVRILVGLFVDPDALPCLDAADVDDNGAVEIADAIGLLRFLFHNAGFPFPPWPLAPFPGFGVDWSYDDPLDCKWP